MYVPVAVPGRAESVAQALGSETQRPPIICTDGEEGDGFHEGWKARMKTA